MDMKLKQNSFMTSNLFSASRPGYIFSQHSLQARPSNLTRGFVTTAIAAKPVTDDSILTEKIQGQHNTKSEMGGLISFISKLPLIGEVQKMFNSLFSSNKSEGEKMSTNTISKELIASGFLPEKCVNPNPVLNFVGAASYCDDCGDKPRKRIQMSSNCVIVNHMNKARPGDSTFNANHFYHKSKVGQKNRLEKQRHNILCDIHDDFGGLVNSNDEEEDFDPINENTQFASFEFGCNEISPKLTVIYKSSPESTSNLNNNIQSNSSLVSKSFIFSLEDFPLIPENSCNRQKHVITVGSPKKTKNGCYFRQDSVEQPSDDEFVVFDDDSVNTTPTSGTGTASLKSLLISRLKCGGRQRQISECSDDSVVIFFESDADQQSCWSDTDLSEGEEANETEDDDSNTVTTIDTHQPDSGFEEREKKVRFCLKPEVHVMRTWDFAYRQARLGPWERYGRDRERFKNRIWRTEQAIAPIFNADHRKRILNERFSENLLGS